MREERRSDTEYKESLIADVEKHSDGSWSVNLDDGWLGVPKESPIEPRKGMTALCYGKGFGFRVRGLVIDSVEVWYRTKAEEKRCLKEQIRKGELERRAEAEKNREGVDRRVAALPKCFRERIQKFRDNNPDFRWRYEGYELFVCEEAVKIALIAKTRDGVVEFQNKPPEEQARMGISGGHSGNTYGMAVRLAYLYFGDQDDVIRAHGAMAVLVGSEDYGCIPTTWARFYTKRIRGWWHSLRNRVWRLTAPMLK